MKKVVLGSLMLSMLLLGACSSTNSSQEDNTNTSSSAKQETVESLPKTGGEQKSSSEDKDTNVGFENGVATLNDMDVKITRHAVIQPGQAGNEYGDDPVIAFWYDTTNKSDKEIDPTSAWMVAFSAYQDNNPDRENKLETSTHPDDQLVSTQMSNIKKGGTVSNAVAYTLTDTTTPVTVVATQGLLGDELGRKDYAIE